MFEFSENQINQLKARGISISDARAMITNINQQSTYSQIHRPATLGDGIAELSESDRKQYANFYEESVDDYRVIRFIPASGMATRMFDFLFPLVVEDQQDFKVAPTSPSKQSQGETFYRRRSAFSVLRNGQRTNRKQSSD